MSFHEETKHNALKMIFYVNQNKLHPVNNFAKGKVAKKVSTHGVRLSRLATSSEVLSGALSLFRYFSARIRASQMPWYCPSYICQIASQLPAAIYILHCGQCNMANIALKNHNIAMGYNFICRTNASEYYILHGDPHCIWTLLIIIIFIHTHTHYNIMYRSITF